MSMSKQSGRLGWLYAALCRQYSRIDGLLRRLSGIAPDPNKPGLFRKFACLLQQVAIEKDEQDRLIREIETVEQQHGLLRQGKKLKIAGPKPSDSKDELEDEGLIHNWRWLLIFWFLFFRRNGRLKNQGLTPN